MMKMLQALLKLRRLIPMKPFNQRVQNVWIKTDLASFRHLKPVQLAIQLDDGDDLLWVLLQRVKKTLF